MHNAQCKTRNDPAVTRDALLGIVHCAFCIVTCVLPQRDPSAFLHVVPRVGGDLALDVAAHHRLAGQARPRREVPRGVQPVGLVVLERAQVLRHRLSR